MNSPSRLRFSPLRAESRPAPTLWIALALVSASGRALAEEATPPQPASAAESKPAAGEVALVESTPADTSAAPPAPAENKPIPSLSTPVPPPQVPEVEWKVQSKGGFILTSGNSQATNVTFGVTGSRKEGNNKLTVEGGMAYGKSHNLVATTAPDPANNNAPVITSLDRKSVVNNNNWATKARYDRFLSENNTAYVSTQWAGDKIAGKVRSITDYGVFIGIEEGVDGMVHKSDLSWTAKVNNPADLFHKGDDVEAIILSMTPHRNCPTQVCTSPAGSSSCAKGRYWRPTGRDRRIWRMM